MLVLLLLAGVSEGLSEGKVLWDAGYPKTGNNEGEILITGTAVPDPEWTLLNAQGLGYWWIVGSGGIGTGNPDIQKDGKFEGKISGIKSGKEYWVVIQVPVSKGGTTINIASDPGKALAK